MENNIKNSNGVNWSYGVNEGNGVNWSCGVNWSNGVNESCGVNESYGIINCYGVDKSIFLADKKRSFTVFGKEVSEERFDEIWNNLFKKLNGWFFKFNTAYLCLKKEGSWEKVDASKIRPTLDDWEEPYEAWKDMPQEAIDYLKSLPEFDEVIFKRVTGIDIKDNNKKNEEKQKLLDKAQELLEKAEELKQEAGKL